MLRGRDPVKRQVWTERLERFSKSGQSVEQFCRANGLSKPSFYQWKQKVREHSGNANVSLGRSRRGKVGVAADAFKMVHVSHDLTGVKVRLPDGIVIDLGSDSSMVETVVRQLLDHQMKGTEAC